MATIAIEQPRQRRGADAVRGAKRVGLVLLGLLVFWGLWEGYRFVGERAGITWPFTVDEVNMNKAAFDRTAKIAQQFKVISKAPSPDAYRTDIAQDAVDELDSEGVDVNGSNWKKANIKVVAGGS